MRAFYDLLAATDPEVFATLAGEENRQRSGIELIPSENYTYPEVLAALGSVFTNKYSEGYPGRRYYGGQEFTDQIENLARQRACAVFGCEHANVQPLSGSPMNQAVYLGLLEPGDTILAMDLSHGGHLTHGAPVSHMGRLFNFVRYKTNPGDGAIDFDVVRALAREHKPKLVLCGYTSYPRDLDYAAFKAIADEVGAYTMCDASHYAGLVAGGVMRNPFDAGFDVVTTTTHKTLRGPRGGMILSCEENGKALNSQIFPGIQGGPLMHVIAAKAVAFGEALRPEFKTYQEQIIKNAQALAKTLTDAGYDLVSGGTDNHLMLIDLTSKDITGKDAQIALDHAGITTNKNTVPFETRSPFVTSGIRLGTPALTTRGMNEKDMVKVGQWIDAVLSNLTNETRIKEVGREVDAFARTFPLFAW